jgi:hypothetical protein
MTAARSAEVRWTASATSLVEGQERHEHQQQDVEADHHAIRTCQAAEDPVVQRPQVTDRDEARRVGQVGRPLVHDALPEVVEITFRDADLEDEQGDRDGKDAVAKRLQAARAKAVAHWAYFDAEPPRPLAGIGGLAKAEPGQPNSRFGRKAALFPGLTGCPAGLLPESADER